MNNLENMEAMGAMATGAVMATKKVAFGSSLLGGMVIFQDPAYFIIATMGAFVSMGSAYYDISKLRKIKARKGEECDKNLIGELGKAFFVGGIFSLLSFLIFLQAGGDAMKSVTGMNWFGKLLPSFWFVLTVALATEAPTIWDKLKAKFIGKKEIDDDE